MARGTVPQSWHGMRASDDAMGAEYEQELSAHPGRAQCQPPDQCLPANYLRMKADFAHRLLDDQELTERFEAFASAARSARRKLIVPMLEDAEEVSRIWQMDVDLIQGNFIQQPSEAPAEA